MGSSLHRQNRVRIPPAGRFHKASPFGAARLGPGGHRGSSPPPPVMHRYVPETGTAVRGRAQLQPTLIRPKRVMP